MIPAAHRPTPRQREHRRLVRHRHQVQGRITSLKCRIRRLLSDYNADCANLFTKAGREYAAGLKLLAADRFVLDELWLSLDHYVERLHAADRALRDFARHDPPPEQQARRWLKTIPGVGGITIDVFLAEIADVRRFSSQKKLTAYAGLSPGYRESAGKRKDQGITHSGSRLLRWILVQAAWQLVRREPRWQRIFEALAKRRGKKKAIVAVARRLLCLMMAIVIQDRPFAKAAAPCASAGGLTRVTLRYRIEFTTVPAGSLQENQRGAFKRAATRPCGRPRTLPGARAHPRRSIG